ncbi:hypothetical protein G7054_g13885 [Neopestalotiopsis clavispora]|nr:hypothetical protein G7054_g13885 [Neopestalotiopsis clavispora]
MSDETVKIRMYEAGGEEGSGFHVFNAAKDQYHRAEVLQRTGAIDITCNLEKIVHGAMAEDSDRYATLVVLKWYFQPKKARRISEATIKLTFKSISGDPNDVEVERISFHDTYSLMPTTQDETTTKGGDASFGVDHVANMTVSGKWEKTISSQRSDAVTLSGQKQLINNRPPNRIAKWTLSENKSQPAGIPASLQVAVLLSREDEEVFHCDVDFNCKTDSKTKAQSLFKKIPVDDPIIFQPDANDKGTRPNRHVVYDDDDLGSVDIDKFSEVNFRTLITNAQGLWE